MYGLKKLLRDVDGLFLKLQILSFNYENTQGKIKFHRENTGKMQGILLSVSSGNHELAY